MKYSIYGSAFNCSIMEYQLEKAVDNFISFVGSEGEVILSTIESKDDTRNRLFALENKYNNFKVIDSKLDISKTNRFDGKLKTEAMNACSNEIRILADIDERFVISQRSIWDKWSNVLLENNQIDGLMIPVIDLYGNKEKIRSDNKIGQKFRLHKSSVYARGVPSFAESRNGLFRSDLSDNTEPIDEFGNLCRFANIVDQVALMPQFAMMLENYPYVIHEGYLDFEIKAKRGREFWAKQWNEYSGKEENVITNKNQLDSTNTIFHNLKLE